MKEFFGLRAKHIDNNDEDEKPKNTKKCVIKRKLKFQDYKNCSEESRIENKINHLERKKLVKIVWKIKKKFMKSNKLILKTKQRFKSESRNVFTEEINRLF